MTNNVATTSRKDRRMLSVLSNIKMRLITRYPDICIIFLFPSIALISAFAAQIALLGFIFPLFISPGACHLMVKDYSHACQRERERGKKKEEDKKAQK